MFTLNGSPHPIPSDNTITGLLIALGIDGQPVVVEHNKSAVFPRDYATTLLSAGDTVEIITIAAGG